MILCCANKNYMRSVYPVKEKIVPNNYLNTIAISSCSLHLGKAWHPACMPLIEGPSAPCPALAGLVQPVYGFHLCSILRET